MTKSVKIVLGLAVSLSIIIVALFFFFRYLAIKSFPKYEGTIVVKGLNHNVTIYRDEFGVPHIFAENENDLMLATGYVHAQDRLWQMDIMRRAADGRLAEVLGSAAVDFDILFRTLNLKEVVEKISIKLPDKVYTALQSYSEGVNEYIKQSKGKYPIEFDIAGYEPELWRVEHSLLISRLIAWELNIAWWVDLTLGKVAEKIDIQRLEEIFPNYPASGPLIIGKKLTQCLESKDKDIMFSASVNGFMKIVQSYRIYFGTDGSAIGSNSWVIDSTLSASGKPILANDPHLSLPAPSRWYEMHLCAPDWDVVGVSIPGTPFVVIGTNKRIAWGFTNAMVDEADFYIEKVDTTNPNFYIYENKKLPFNIKKEKIYIGKKDSIIIQPRYTHHGPVISDIHPNKKYITNAQPPIAVAMKWVGHEVSFEPLAFYYLNKSKNVKDFENGVKELAVPGQNVIYADVDGNIAYWTAAKVPIRGKQNATLPLPGWLSESEWKGFVQFEKLPRLWNPKEGFIATANNKFVENYPYYISNLYMPPWRIERIRELLQSATKFSVEDFKKFQTDYVSLHAKTVIKLINNLFENFSDTSIAYKYIKNWDYKHSSTDIASTIFNTFFVNLLKNIFEDELGTELFNDYVYFSALPINAVDALLKLPNSVWYDNINTEEIETKEHIIRKSFFNALEELKKKLGTGTQNWQWGRLHTVEFQHPLGAVKPLDKVFNIGPFPIGGSMSTINNGEYKFNEPYNNYVGPSMRMIVDLSQPSEYYSIITTGQSGQPLHRHYSNQTQLWLNGIYKTVISEKNDIQNFEWIKLTLITK